MNTLESESTLIVSTAKKQNFPLRISSVNVAKPHLTEDLVTFTEEILNGKVHFLCNETHALVPFLNTNPILNNLSANLTKWSNTLK